ncbi:MAG TPA: T9SS type A sorting domain-containing protein [Bacteroidota bacterium]|nr:T9SS type A sorting domain-containing protein [Bacteroidota bacterium]
MKRLVIVVTLLVISPLFSSPHLFAQSLPLVYDVENTGASYPAPFLPSVNALPVIQALPDPFEWADGRGRIAHYSDWEYRRNEIGAQIQNYEIGVKPPPPDTITASYSGGTLTVKVIANGDTLVLTSQVVLPAGSGPFPAVIGIDFPSGSIPSSVFTSRNVAEISFVENQVTTDDNPKTTDPYYKLYPALNPTNTGQYSAWAWGVSRIIDGLELVQSTLPIDLKHIAVTGCSYAGKMALYAGAFDERIALTIAQESGGGGATSWRYSHTLPYGTVEDIDNTDYNWFADGMKQFAGSNVSLLPEDHHELMAMCAPRALYVTANPDYVWLSNPSCDVCSKACEQIYAGLGIPDRFGFSIIGGHSHCAVPDSQIPEIGAFVDKFLLGKDSASTNIADSPYSTDLSPWITWSAPVLTSGSSYFQTTSLVSPPNLQKGADTTITFQWHAATGAQRYLLQLSTDITFHTNTRNDSTADTTATISGLSKSRLYYWRIQIHSASGPGPWSDVWQVSTAGPLPGKPVLIPVVSPDSSLFGYLGFQFTWNSTAYAAQYVVEISNDSTFVHINSTLTTVDTLEHVFGFVAGTTYYWRVQASNVIGAGPWSDVAPFPQAGMLVKGESVAPTVYALSQNYPNPFNPTTTINFALPKAGRTTVAIYDILGRQVRTLVDRELQEGNHTVIVDASAMPSGVYFYCIRSGSFVETKKMVLLK